MSRTLTPYLVVCAGEQVRHQQIVLCLRELFYGMIPGLQQHVFGDRFLEFRRDIRSARVLIVPARGSMNV
jgi:hypothetical protein